MSCSKDRLYFNITRLLKTHASIKFLDQYQQAAGFCVSKMMEKAVYEGWAKAWGAGMTYEGECKQGEFLIFCDASGSGMKAKVDELVAPNHLKMTHVAFVSKNVELTTLDDSLKAWIGTKEEYYFSSNPDGSTKLDIKMESEAEFAEMGKAWPTALQYLKEICES